MKKSRKTILLIIAALILAVGCSIAADLVGYRYFTVREASKKPIFTDGSEVLGIYSCSITDGELTVTGVDPQFVVGTNDCNFSDIQLSFREPTAQDTILQIFYVAPGEGFSEANSIVKVIPAGRTEMTVKIPKATYSLLRFDFEQNVKMQGIYVYEESGALPAYQPDFTRIAIVFIAVFVPLLALILLFQRASDIRERKHKPIWAIILCNLFLTLTVLFFQPLDHVLMNQSLFWFSYEQVWWIQLLIAVGACAVLSLIMLLLPEKGGIIAASIALGLGLAFLMQVVLFSGSRPLIRKTTWSIESLSLFIWIGIFTTIMIAGIKCCAGKKGRRMGKVLCAAAWILIVCQVMNMAILKTSVKTEKVNDQATESKVAVSDNSGYNNLRFDELEKEVLNTSMYQGIPFPFNHNFSSNGGN